MRRIAITILLSLATFGLAQVPPGFEKVDTEITITTVENKMVYNLDSFSVKPGSTLKLTLTNPDNLQHNLIICHPAANGKDDRGKEIADAALALGAEGFAKEYVPAGHPRLLANTRMVNPKGSDTIYVKVPTKEGAYPYLCTFPGHSLLMRGTMSVETFKPGLSDLTFKAYKGDWNKLPDFGPLTPYKTGKAKKLDIGVAETKEKFAMVWDATFTASKAGEYTFNLGSDDGSRLWIGDTLVCDADGIHPMQIKTGKIKLEAGTYPIKVAYFEKGGQEEFYLGYKAPGKNEVNLSTGKKGGGGAAAKGYPITPLAGEAVMYRNFVDGGGPRAIAVGLPEGFSYCYDANAMRLAMMWLGDFMDGAKHWNGRGQGFQPPAGDGVVTFEHGKGIAPLAALPGADATWPTELQPGEPANRPVGFRFRGYRLDTKRQPTFMYDMGETKVTDFIRVENIADASLTRTITLSGTRPDSPLFFDVAQGALSAEGAGFIMDDAAYITIEGAAASSIEAGRLVAAFGSGDSITIRYQWR